MIRKRNVSVILVLALLFSCVSCVLPFAVSAEQSVMYGRYETAVNLIHKIDLIQDIEDFKPDKKVSRADFVFMLVKMLKLPINTGASKQIFFDVPSSNEYFSYIESAYRAGVITGNELGYFEPDKYVSRTDALTMIIKAINYDAVAQLKGGYPTGYQILGVELRLFDNIGSETDIAYGEAAQLFYNLGFMEGRVIFVDNESVKYQAGGSQSIFSRLYNIYKGEGIVDANFLASLPKGPGVRRGTVNIAGESFEAGSTDVQEHLGYSAVYYYKDTDGTKELIVMDYGKNNVLKMDSYDVEKYEPANVTYMYNDRLRSAKVSPVATPLLNGQVYTFLSDEMPVPTEGSFELIDNDNDSIYDVVKVIDYGIMITANVNVTEKLIFGKAGGKAKLDLTEYEYYDIVDYDGNTMLLDEIKSNFALSVAESDNKQYVKIIVSNRYVEVLIAEISSDSRYTTIISNEGEVFKVSLSVKNPAGIFEVGNKYTLIIDAFGKVAGILSEQAIDMEYGYLVKWISNASGLSNSFSFKIFTINGEIKIVESAPKISLTYYDEITGDLINISISSQKKLEEMLIDSQLIRYRLNSEGKLSAVEIAGTDKLSNVFRVVGKTSAGDNSTNNRYKATTRTIGGQILIGDDTKAFFVPQDDNAEDKEYTVSTSKLFVNDAYYPGAIGYSSKANSSVADIVVIGERERVVEGASPVMLFEKLTDSVDSDGNQVKRLYGFSDGGYFSYNMKEGLPLSYKTATGDIVPLESGDVIQFVLNSEGNISNFKILFDASQKRVYGKNDRIDVSTSNTANLGFADESRQSSGYAEARRENCLYLTHDGFSYISGDTYVLSTAAIYEYNPNSVIKTKGNPITLYDIVTREDNPSAPDYVFISMRYSEPRIVVIYK